MKKWCQYCKGSIKEGENFAVIDGEYYHIECIKQMNTFYDSLDIGDTNES